MQQIQIKFNDIKNLDNKIIQQIKTKLYVSGNNVLYGIKNLSQYCLDNIKLLLKNNSNYQNQKQLIKAIYFDYNLSACKICNKQLNIRKRHNIYCSYQCKFKDQQYRINVKNILYQKYGVTHNFLIKDIRQKALKNSCSKQSKQKRQKTNLQRYGVEVSSKNQIVKQKMIQTNLQKYGNKFGVFNISKCKVNSKNSMYQLAWQNFKKFEEYIIPNFTFQEYKGIDKEYQWKCVKCGNIFKQKIRTTKHINGLDTCPRCIQCYPYRGINGRISVQQNQLKQFCKQYYSNLIENDRELIKPYQLDIVIPQIKLAIEFNGLYWHSLEGKYQLGYHLMKTQLCQIKGYRLIHIWQDQWKNNKESIKQKLINIFQNKEQIKNDQLLDRCWYSILQFQKYQIIQQKILIKNNYHIQNCGYILIK